VCEQRRRVRFGACNASNCPPVSIECNNCLNDLTSCTLLGFCASMFACADPPKPGGDCDEIRDCCNAQTVDERKAACLAALDTLIPIVGELGCTSAQADQGFTLLFHKSPECPWGTRPESVP
jgi:hypothetical protein